MLVNLNKKQEQFQKKIDFLGQNVILELHILKIILGVSNVLISKEKMSYF